MQIESRYTFAFYRVIHFWPGVEGRIRTGEGNGGPLQYSSWEIPGRGAWQATVHGVTKSWTQLVTEQPAMDKSMLKLSVFKRNVSTFMKRAI